MVSRRVEAERRDHMVPHTRSYVNNRIKANNPNLRVTVIADESQTNILPGSQASGDTDEPSIVHK